MSISSVNGDPRGDCPVWGPEDGEFFPVGMGMEEKVPPKEVDGSPRELWGSVGMKEEYSPKRGE
ncbi:hypothetical protein A2U01_0001428 [Trifolium medium]|uniref:Uncharacterized protein n=1 Tax=Trifolium medium TaxID=97028 RepID=A0A392M031_9FABA|nr:hypothetical protein [Trifolium medium]